MVIVNGNHLDFLGNDDHRHHGLVILIVNANVKQIHFCHHCHLHQNVVQLVIWIVNMNVIYWSLIVENQLILNDLDHRHLNGHLLLLVIWIEILNDQNLIWIVIDFVAIVIANDYVNAHVVENVIVNVNDGDVIYLHANEYVVHANLVHPIFR